MKNKVNLAIFASGNGSNAKKIIEYFFHHPVVDVRLVVSNRVNAGVLSIADESGIEGVVLSKEQLADAEILIPILEERAVDLIILAGFLLKIPSFMTERFPHRIINIHPSLLPKFGGKGMYGLHVHQAVKAAKVVVSGMTIHYVNEKYDDGEIILQKTCEVRPNDSAEDIARKVLALEHLYFAPAIEKICLNFQKKSY